MSRFDVELVGFEAEPDVAGLARAFGLDEVSARALVESVPHVVKRDVDEAAAEQLFHALRDVGAKVQLHRLAPRAVHLAPRARARAELGRYSLTWTWTGSLSASPISSRRV